MGAAPSVYLLVGFLRNQGRCQCGWTGKSRWLRGSAMVDVFEHSHRTGHLPAEIVVRQSMNAL
ncbi:hypothetical protein BVC93_06995 [Mycobacterium sp. MS1601]|nr:hypothetical protein BVC93_06995 [Mycobacterium sp. MS1601]